MIPNVLAEIKGALLLLLPTILSCLLVNSNCLFLQEKPKVLQIGAIESLISKQIESFDLSLSVFQLLS